VVEIPAAMVPLMAAHLDTLNEDPNPLDLVFPSEVGTPLYPKNVRRRHFAPAAKGWASAPSGNTIYGARSSRFTSRRGRTPSWSKSG
jgi:hypothetical protein